MSGENTERDLYSDLVEECGGNGETLVRTQNIALRERIRKHEDEILGLRLQLRDVEEANVRLKEENLTLEKNISCLYKTAVLVSCVTRFPAKALSASSVLSGLRAHSQFTRKRP